MAAEPGTEAGDELDVLTTLVVAYEKEHYPLSAPDPISAIEFRVEQRHLKRRDLEPFIGSRARVSEVLSGKRPLTLAMIRKLSPGLNIPADLLINDSSLSQPQLRTLSPQEKKRLSLERDRRNVYGENAKSSRKNIPLAKALANRAVRHAADAPLRNVAGPFDESTSDGGEFQARTGQMLRPRKRFSKQPDVPLGDVLQRKAGQKGRSRAAFGTPPRHLKKG